MRLRKVLDFKGIVGITIPKEMSNALDIVPKDYVEVYLRDKRTVVIKKHGIEPKKITIYDTN